MHKILEGKRGNSGRFRHRGKTRVLYFKVLNETISAKWLTCKIIVQNNSHFFLYVSFFNPEVQCVELSFLQNVFTLSFVSYLYSYISVQSMVFNFKYRLIFLFNHATYIPEYIKTDKSVSNLPLNRRGMKTILNLSVFKCITLHLLTY